jgi:hypothetical protein
MGKDSKPLTIEEKRKRGYKQVGEVNGVPVFLALRITNAKGDKGDIMAVPESAREHFLKVKTEEALAREKRRQEGSETANGPLVFETTESGRNFLCKQTGTRTWMILSKKKGLEIFSKENVKIIREKLAALPDVDVSVGAASDDEDEE